MEELIRFTEPEQDERLKQLAMYADENAIIKSIYGYLKQYGAVRKDVYELILAESNSFSKPDYNFLVELLRCQAEKTWYELFLKIGNEKQMSSLYKRELVDAFRKGVAVCAATECYEKADSPFDMYRMLQNTMKLQEHSVREEEKEGREEDLLRSRLNEMSEALKSANEEIERLRRKYEGKENDERGAEEVQCEQIVEDDVSDVSEEGQAGDAVDIPEPEAEDETEPPEKEDKKVASKKNGRRVCILFQKIRQIRQRAAFERMTPQRKMEELFLLLREQKYTPDMIKDVRTLIEYGITFEFLYAFVESKATETELRALVEYKTPG